MVELILGHLIGAPSSRDGIKHFFCVSVIVSKTMNGNQVMNGFELLKAHADRSIIWNSRVSGPCLQGSHPLFDAYSCS
jgi:hypothetical protein